MDAVSAAFLSGPMYDPLYSHHSVVAAADRLGLRVDFRGNHPELNHHLSPVRYSVMEQRQASAQPRQRARWKALQEVIEHHVLIPPTLACYPEMEEVIWKTVQAAVVGTMAVSESLESITQQMQQIGEAQYAR